MTDQIQAAFAALAHAVDIALRSEALTTGSFARINGGKRGETLSAALDAGADEATMLRLAAALRVAKLGTVVLPSHRFESLSRGRGWARKGRGDSAQWGERDDNGYRVGPGRWTVGGHDGFSRKGEEKWAVEHVTVGSQTWTVAS